MQKLTAIGHVGAAPETRTMPSGDKVTNFSLACTERWTDKATGEKKERTEWLRCVVFRKAAEIIAEYVSKGDKLYIEGKLSTSTYEKDAVIHYSTDIVVSEFEFLTPKAKPSEPEPFELSALANG